MGSAGQPRASPSSAITPTRAFVHGAADVESGIWLDPGIPISRSALVLGQALFLPRIRERGPEQKKPSGHACVLSLL